MLTLADCLIAPSQLWHCAELDLPIGFVALEDIAEDSAIRALPAFPLIGIGAVDHPVAAVLDAIVEPPVSAERLLRQVSARPRTAAAAVLLLRALDGVGPAAALTLESACMAMLQGSAEHRDWLESRMAVSAGLPGEVRIERCGDRLTIRLARAGADNAIDRVTRDALAEAFELAALDSSIRQIRWEANGRAFSLGADRAEFGTTRDPATAHLIRAQTLPARALVAIGDRLEVHVQGGCVGAGLEMAAFGGRVTATRDAWFQLPELAMGLIPGAGGCVSVPRRIGRQRTALMLLSSRRIGARAALNWGLIDAIVDDDTADDRGADGD
jgi:enoyl-CoA hydratase/carnithine racemase